MSSEAIRLSRGLFGIPSDRGNAKRKRPAARAGDGALAKSRRAIRSPSA